MSLQGSSNMGYVHRIMSSLKQFDEKLDKLQDDMNYHGQTLNDLRSLVFGLSAGTIINPDGKQDGIKRYFTTRVSKPNAAIQLLKQYDHSLPNRSLDKRKYAVQPMPSKMQAKTNENHLSFNNRCSPLLRNKASSPRENSTKYSHVKATRPNKTEAPRKATTLRTQQGMDKKRSNSVVM